MDRTTGQAAYRAARDILLRHRDDYDAHLPRMGQARMEFGFRALDRRVDDRGVQLHTF